MERRLILDDMDDIAMQLLINITDEQYLTSKNEPEDPPRAGDR